jgi:glycine/D-amino acid oxidase-like deaminating enzyme
MNAGSERAGHLVSFWERTAEIPRFPALDRNIRVDVAIVGAGIAGMMTAYQLSREGRRVAVLDAGPAGGRMTARTTAHLVNALDDRFYEIETFHGSLGAHFAAESHTAAIDRYEQIVAEEGIDCQFERVSGYLILPPGGAPEMLERELAAAHRAGLTGVERVTRAPLPSFDSGPALHFPRQGQMHPLRFLSGIAAAIVRRGGQIFAETRVTDVEGGASAREN